MHLRREGAKANIGTLADHEDFVNVYRVSSLRFGKGVYFEDIAFSYSKLATLCFDSGFRGKSWRANRDR